MKKEKLEKMSRRLLEGQLRAQESKKFEDKDMEEKRISYIKLIKEVLKAK